MTAPAIFLIPVAFYAIEHLFSGRKSAREQEVAERRPLDSAIPVQRELPSGVSR
jgi:hypothetical protein